MTDSPQSEHHENEDVENDAVSGTAFRTSLIVFVIAAMPVPALEFTMLK